MPYGVVSDGEPVELVVDQPFTTFQLRLADASDVAQYDGEIGDVVQAVINHPAGQLAALGDEELARYLIQTFAEAAAPQAGERLATRTLAIIDGAISVQATYEALPAPVVPQVVSMLQAEIELAAAGKLEAVKAAVAGADAVTQIYWARATQIHRDHPVVIALGAAVGLSADDIDQLFIAAAALT